MANHSHPHEHNGKLTIAVLINILLTVAQVIGGMLSGSLSLIADALHNLSDAGALVVAILARKIGAKPATPSMTYGYKRAEILGVVINSTTLILIGLYLVIEAIDKYLNPIPIDGWIVIWVAGIALIIDVLTAILTYKSGARNNMNIRAAFIHNVSDAMASVAVIFAGVLIIFYDLYVVDVIATIGISLYVIFHGCLLLKKAIKILMQAVPEGLDIKVMQNELEKLDHVKSVSHIHVWQLDENKLFFEGHAQIAGNIEETKKLMRSLLETQFKITHCTIESTE
ncbi:cation diffusion facilitator family transporter [Kordiimonas lipolytica]|uniref:Cation diffusion facilitator family transporter n=1 Tax=Kordiimonas lipolytica TaxID=1662421 RepID=A0ABV8UF36_9PROT|nr:cation diffusion facilitator family transporter [Kordiimonas lipolytica]